MAKKELTQSKLKKFLNYNPETGEFNWISRHSGGTRSSLIAGTTLNTGYESIHINNAFYLSHRLACLYMTGSFPEAEIDHINRNRKDNRWINLRLVSRTENSKNAPLRKDSKSGCTGVTWCNERRKWAAYIKVNYKKISLGRHDSLFEACCRRLSANIKYGFHENHGQS